MIRATGRAADRALRASGGCKERRLSVVASLLDRSVSATAAVGNRDYAASCSLKAVSFMAAAWRLERVRTGNYIKVDKDTIWVTPDIMEQLMIMSNTDWVII